MTIPASPERPALLPSPWKIAPDFVSMLRPDSAIGLGLIRISGADAATFLHGQLTQDVAGLPEGRARWAGYCSPKGRLSATARMWRTSEGYWLAVSADLAVSLSRRLSMFVLRAKAKVQDCSADRAVFGVMGTSAHAQVMQWLGIHPASGGLDSSDAVLAVEAGVLVGLPALMTPAGPLPRSLLIVAQDPLQKMPPAWQLDEAEHRQQWLQAEVLAAVPRINASTADCFVPQMVNFESVDGVNFTKGCYPGQEVVARSQYLGKLRRRMFLATGQGQAPAPASDVVIEGEAEPVGQYVMSAPLDEGFIALFECRTDRAEQIGLQLLPLPYALRTQD